MTADEHDKRAREQRIETLMNTAKHSRAVAERIDDMSTQATLAALVAVEAIVNECPEAERPYVYTQAQMMLHANVGACLEIQRMMARLDAAVIIVAGTPEQQGKAEPTMPKKDLG